MKATRSLILFLTFLLLSGVAPVAYSETPFTALAVKWAVDYPPDPSLPASLSLAASFHPPDPILPASEAVLLEAWPPQPCVPPDPGAPIWQLSLPVGCFEATRPGNYRLDEEACAVSLRLMCADGTVVEDLTGRIESLAGKFKPPRDGEAWQFKLNLGVSVADGDGGNTAWPPQPCRGRTKLWVGEQVGEAPTAHCEWDGTQ